MWGARGRGRKRRARGFWERGQRRGRWGGAAGRATGSRTGGGALRGGPAGPVEAGPAEAGRRRAARPSVARLTCWVTGLALRLAVLGKNIYN